MGYQRDCVIYYSGQLDEALAARAPLVLFQGYQS